MSRALLLFTIGPVKQFVEPSRKLKDLYAGSFLLSHLALQTKGFFDEHDGTVFIPAPKAESAPNRLIVSVENIEKAKQLAEQAEKYVQKQFLLIAKEIIESSRLQFNDAVKNQLNGFLEVNWAAEPMEYDFQMTYKKLLKHMHSTKNTRMFQQIAEAPARKCDLYEQYNALFTNYEKPLSNLQKTNLKKRENLSAIAIVKRNLSKWAESQPIPFDMNVTSVAYMLLKSYLPESADISHLKDEGSEALFNLKNNDDFSINNEYAENTKERAREIYKEFHKFLGSPYYAIVKLDGDGVGAKYQEITSVSQAQSLSDEISAFSNEAKRIIEENKGVCVFAGGEDILAFLPLHTLFDTLIQLTLEFRNIKELNHKGTLSSGIIIAHLMSPLKPLLQQVESLEAHAKAIDEEKAAFSMNIMRRGGLVTPVRLKFGENSENLITLQNLIKVLQTQEQSHSFVYSIVSILAGIEDTVTEELLETLLRKLLRSSQIQSSKVEEHLDIMLNTYQLVDNDTNLFVNVLKQISFLARSTFQTSVKEEVLNDV